MTILGLDYAGGRLAGAVISASGYQFVCRYLSDGGPTLPGKLLIASEYADLQANGVAVVVNWETVADRMLAGYNAGAADAAAAQVQLKAVGYPLDRPVYFSADFDATPAQQAEIDAYLRGCASVVGLDRAGVYGGYWVVKRCLDRHTASWAWQTGAWSGGNIDPRIHIYQRIGTVTVGGVECDVNEARQADFGQHPGDGDMTPEQDQLLREIHDEIYRQIPTRAGNGPNPGYTDTTLGYAANSDGFGWRNEQRLVVIQTALWTLIRGLLSKGVIDSATLSEEYRNLALPAWPQNDNPFSATSPPANQEETSK